MKADLLVHLGHEEYFAMPGSLGVRVIYIPVFYTRPPSTGLLVDLVNKLRELGVVNTSLSYTLIEKKLAKQIVSFLENSGFRVFDVDKPILGCLYSHVFSLEDRVDVHVVVAGGLFHAIGLGLVSSKPVLGLDPYMEKIWNASLEANRVLKNRLYAIYRARERGGSRVGLIVGTRPGQYRSFLYSYIEREASMRGFTVYKITSNYLTIDRLMAIDNALDLDLYVVTSCPRLPIDDLMEFHKPVLTPGEFLAMIRGEGKYIYPW